MTRTWDEILRDLEQDAVWIHRQNDWAEMNGLPDHAGIRRKCRAILSQVNQLRIAVMQMKGEIAQEGATLALEVLLPDSQAEQEAT